jgi:uncharacterized 2Fe-2S/4Fe-4S cluster protein (DUF4445 family)
MCAAVAAFGWPWLGAQATGVGLSPMVLLKVAAVGGTVAAVAWWALLPLLFGARAPEAFE